MAEHNGRQATSPPSSSSSDFYANDASQIRLPDSSTHAAVYTPPALVHDEVDQDSDSMDLSSDDDSSTVASEVPVATSVGTKRKISDAVSDVDGPSHTSAAGVKKARISALATPSGYPLAAGLPVEIWQRVFTQLSPAMLCRCLRVCKAFNLYLSRIKTNPALRKTRTAAQAVESETIWTASRRNIYPSMPRPLMGHSELQMLQLIAGQTCEACRKRFTRYPPTSIYNAGPGPDGIRVIYQFRMRVCGTCLKLHTMTDVDLLQDKKFLPTLRRGLPYAFLTGDFHTIPEFQVRSHPGGIPPHIRLSKVYARMQVSTVMAEFQDAESLGPGAADEWKKGLDERGKEVMIDALRWERWEEQLPPGTSLPGILREYDLSSFSAPINQQQQDSTAVAGGIPATAMPINNGPHRLPRPVHVFGLPSAQQTHTVLETPQSMNATALAAPPSQRSVRDPQQAQEAQRARRADIERRCMQLEPPLEPLVLQHIEAFLAAVQIPKPMTDKAWDLLLPRILAQREAAELVEHQRAHQLALLQAVIPTPAQNSGYNRPSKDSADEEYEKSQEKLRLKLKEYATDRIHGHWGRGTALDHDTAPVFATDVLISVYERYLADLSAGILPADDQQSNPAQRAFLSLDNMKWVFDNKVRSYTDRFRRELFLCHDCTDEKRPKWFAFEGLIQHYGAKHTSAFSQGNVVVHWQTAEWPDEPPFHPNPSYFIGAERKYTNKDPSKRAKGITQTASVGPSHSRGSGSLNDDTSHLPENAAGNGSNPPGHAHRRIQQQDHSDQPSGMRQQADRIHLNAEVQVGALADGVHAVWDLLEGVKDLLECVRVRTVFYHVVIHFTEKFHVPPSLDVLTSAFAIDPALRSIKSAHAIACNYCEPRATGNNSSYYPRMSQKKLYNLGALINHFKIAHVPHDASPWDWHNVIDLPEASIIADLINATGMDDQKLSLIAEAFPGAFPNPLPKISTVKGHVPGAVSDSGLAHRLLKRLEKQNTRQAPKKKLRAPDSPGGGRDSSEDAIPEPKEDEYDPRKPMLAQSDQNALLDLAKFDTDIARQLAASVAQPGTNSVNNPGFSLAPETIAALQSLISRPDVVNTTHYEAVGVRSPSVGVAEPVVRVGANNNETSAAPDIAAIIASITGGLKQQHASTPSTAISRGERRSVSIESNPTGVQQKSEQASIAYSSTAEDWHLNDRYPFPMSSQPHPVQDIIPKPREDRPDGQDLLAALSRATQRYEPDTRTTYVEGPFAAPTHHYQNQSQAPRSPPRYRVVYGNELDPYARPPSAPHQNQVYHTSPMQNEQIRYEPIDAAPLVPYRSDRVHYSTHQPTAERTIYVDAHGRRVELIPVDSPPARVQYLQHPYEQVERGYAGQDGGGGGEGGPRGAPMYARAVEPLAPPQYPLPPGYYAQPTTPRGDEHRYM